MADSPLSNVRLFEKTLWKPVYPSVASGSRFPCQPREPWEEKRGLCANNSHPFSILRSQAGMGHKIWLPFRCSSRPLCPRGCWGWVAGFTNSLGTSGWLSGHQRGVCASHVPEGHIRDAAGSDTDFHLASPEGRAFVFEQRKSDGVYAVGRD